VDDEVRATALLRKAVMFRVELMAIKSKAEFHGESIGKSGGFGYPRNWAGGGREGGGSTNLRHDRLPGQVAARGTKVPANEPNEDKLWFDPFSMKLGSLHEAQKVSF
jgi:hypothetical protein